MGQLITIGLGFLINLLLWRSRHKFKWTALVMTVLGLILFVGNEYQVRFLAFIPETILYGLIGSVFVKWMKGERVITKGGDPVINE